VPETKMQKKPRRWKGRLAKKIQPQINRPQGLAIPADPAAAAKVITKANEQMVELFRRAVEKEYDEKLNLLFQHFKITRGDLRALAIRLATELGIPGFQVEVTLFEIEGDYYGPVLGPDRKEGRPTKWTLEQREELRAVVEKIQKETGGTGLDALKYLVAQYPKKWGPPAGYRGSWQKTLQNRLAEAKKMHHFIEDEVNKNLKLLEEIAKKIPKTKSI